MKIMWSPSFTGFAVGTLLDRNADSVLMAQGRFLNQTPALLNAIKLIGLDRDEDTAVRAARDADNLSILASTPLQSYPYR
ncbi:hypothetical protein PHO31112_04772 [Pandoraea horticolens]|uniref:Uncharacterized protein n=1 Tax=Pandoraea horticolens TaxID=2508298 RepID=A0A5E4YUU7_9BURK|nr:hypothetical protein PHO31112_04772 [Pandoraea horticolens]